MLARLTQAIEPVAPIFGVSGPSTGPSSAITIDFKSEATQPQRDAAQVVLTNFDWSQSAHDAWLLSKGTLEYGKVTAVRLESNQSNNTNVYEDCVGLALPIDIGNFNFTFDGSYTTDNVATGLGLQLNGPAFSTLLYGVEIATVRDADGICQWFVDLRTGWNSGGPAKASATGRQPFHIFGSVTTTESGILQVRFRSEDPGVAVVIQRKSFGMLTGVK